MVVAVVDRSHPLVVLGGVGQPVHDSHDVLLAASALLTLVEVVRRLGGGCGGDELPACGDNLEVCKSDLKLVKYGSFSEQIFSQFCLKSDLKKSWICPKWSQSDTI